MGGPGSAAAASAATGRTETPSAARSGEIAKPATSSITSRNRTAVNAAVVNASATREAVQRRRGGRRQAAAGNRREATTARPDSPRHAARGVDADSSSAVARCAARPRGGQGSGTCTTKIARQSNTSVRAPPIAGPAAVPISAAPSHQRRPVCDSPASSAS